MSLPVTVCDYEVGCDYSSTGLYIDRIRRDIGYITADNAHGALARCIRYMSHRAEREFSQQAARGLVGGPTGAAHRHLAGARARRLIAAIEV